MHRAVRWLILFAALSTGVAGLFNGPLDLLNATNLAERLLAVSVSIYGVTGVISFLALWRRQRWLMVPFLIWASAATFAGTFASAYYSPPGSMWISGIFSGISCVVLLMLILVQVHREKSTY
jgi:hypothetical protein